MPVHTGILRTLVVDDNPDFIRAACEWIGCEQDMEIVGTAHDGRAALLEVERLRPDLVIIDVVMPVMDGVEATRRIKARPDAPTVILITLHDSAAIQRHAFSAGADAILSKRELVEALGPLLATLRGKTN